jgi:hypothetical protein
MTAQKKLIRLGSARIGLGYGGLVLILEPIFAQLP